MASRGVVILSGLSLFAEGAASSLRRSTESLQFTGIDSREPQSPTQITELAPATVILDTTDTTLGEHCSLTALLDVIPDLCIIRLDPMNEQIQIVIGECRKATSIAKFIEVISVECASPEGN